MKKFLLIIILVFLVAVLVFYFQKPPNPIGLYVAKNNIHTIDSLWIMEEGSYKRAIYDAENKELLYRNAGMWKYENGRLLFKDFFPNDDQPLKKGYAFESVLMTFSVPLEKSFGRAAFDYDEATGKFQFYKPYF